MDPSHHSWLLVQSHPAIGLVLIAIEVELEYKSISRSLSGWGPKGEPNASITVESGMTDLLRLLKLIWQPNLSMLAIGVESEYRSVIDHFLDEVLKESPMLQSPLRVRSRIS
jgi:hypothetical protein